jgi:hypothetical protein
MFGFHTSSSTIFSSTASPYSTSARKKLTKTGALDTKLCAVCLPEAPTVVVDKSKIFAEKPSATITLQCTTRAKTQAS